MSFDPHPNLAPHPYIEWFSTGKNHYRIELVPADAWIVGDEQVSELDGQSQRIRRSLAGQVVTKPAREESEWV